MPNLESGESKRRDTKTDPTELDSKPLDNSVKLSNETKKNFCLG